MHSITKTYTIDEIKGYINGVLSVLKEGPIDRSFVETILQMLDHAERPVHGALREVIVTQPVWYWGSGGLLVRMESLSGAPAGSVTYNSTIEAYQAKGQQDAQAFLSQGQTG